MLSILTGIFTLGTLVSGLTKVLEVVGKVFHAAAQALTTFANELGLTETEKADDLGTKRIQAEEKGIVPENYDNFSDYLKEIDKFDIDEESAKNISEDEKFINGAAVAAMAISEKFPEQDITGLVEGVMKNPEYYNDERFKELSKLAGDSPEYIDAIAKAFSGEELEENEYYEVKDMITALEKAAYPDLSPEEIKERVNDIMG